MNKQFMRIIMARALIQTAQQIIGILAAHPALPWPHVFIEHDLGGNTLAQKHGRRNTHCPGIIVCIDDSGVRKAETEGVLVPVDI